MSEFEYDKCTLEHPIDCVYQIEYHDAKQIACTFKEYIPEPDEDVSRFNVCPYRRCFIVFEYEKTSEDSKG